MKMQTTELQVVRFAADDVIATSGLGALSGENGLFYIPASDYTGSYSGTGNYVAFNGTFGSYNGSAYEITNIYGAEAGIDDDKALLESVTNGMVYFADMGVSVPADPTMMNIAKNAYDAFSYGNGVYYTNGTSYYESHWQ